MTGQTLAFALIVVLLVGMILGLATGMVIDWWARRKWDKRRAGWIR